MTLTPEQKEHAIDLIEMGEKLEAVRYFQEVLTIDAEQALLLAEKLEQEIEPELDLQGLQQKGEEMKRSGAKVGRLVGLIFMSIGMVMLAVAGYLIYAHQQFEKNAVGVKGTVVEFQSYISSNDNSSTTMYTPVFEYAYEGKNYTYVSTSSSNVKEYAVGEPVAILVDPENPDDVLVNSFMEKWFVPTLLGFMGTLFTGLGYVAYAVFGKKS
jgi:tetrahydromethanopterin S-methyltransferase subunit G